MCLGTDCNGSNPGRFVIDRNGDGVFFEVSRVECRRACLADQLVVVVEGGDAVVVGLEFPAVEDSDRTEDLCRDVGVEE